MDIKKILYVLYWPKRCPQSKVFIFNVVFKNKTNQTNFLTFFFCDCSHSSCSSPSPSVAQLDVIGFNVMKKFIYAVETRGAVYNCFIPFVLWIFCFFTVSIYNCTFQQEQNKTYCFHLYTSIHIMESI